MRRRIAQVALTGATAAMTWALYLLHSTQLATRPYSLTEPRRAAAGAGFTVLLLALAYLLGLPDAVRSVRRAVTASWLAPAAAVAVVSLVQLGVGDAFLPRFVVFASLLAAPLVNMAVSLPLVAANRFSGVRTVVLADPDQVDEMEAALQRVDPQRLRVLRVFQVDADFDPAILTVERLEAELGEPVDVVVASEEAMHRPDVTPLLSSLHLRGVRIRRLLDFYGEWFRLVPLSELEDASLLFDIGEIHSPLYARLKRIVDAGSGVVLLTGFALSLPFVLVGNRIGNRGPLLFRQSRVGRDGEEFEMVKLRTMNTGGSGADRWTTQNDPRVTPFGRWLRRLHIDELPQGLNILRGDLSMVGPRPEQPHYVDRLRQAIPFYDVRHIVRPGVTGWAQIALGYTSDVDGAKHKLQYELYYIRNQSISWDLRIILQTVRSSLRRGGT